MAGEARAGGIKGGRADADERMAGAELRRAPAVDESGATVGDRGGNWGEASGEPGATDVHVADVEKKTGPSGG